jgi:transcriptional regulator with AAA-type ATPase domain
MPDPHTGNTTVPTPEDPPVSAANADNPPLLSFVVLWCSAQPDRAGESAVLAARGRPYAWGREDACKHAFPPIHFVQDRPLSHQRGLPFTGKTISRDQLHVQARAGYIEMTVVGACPTFVNGERVACDKKFNVVPGDHVYLKDQLLLLCMRRPARLPHPEHFPWPAYGHFGGPDSVGLVGESPALWALREQIAAAAKSTKHTLVLGPTGSGKELVAGGIHLLSKRADRPFVAVNCAAIPQTLLRAELFGNAKGYPDSQMAARPGYVGAAEGGTLFLDEIGEMSHEAQAALLRMLNENGDYQRLGESTMRKADLVVVAATNRPWASLKHDLAPRFEAVIDVPPLEKRREDIPLLVRHLLLNEEARGNELAQRFLVTSPEGYRHPDLDGEVMGHLVRGDYPDNVRGLSRELQKVLAAGGELPPSVRPPEPERSEEHQLTTDELLAGLEKVRGNVTELGKMLNLSRQQVYRALEKHGLSDN